MKTFIKFFLTAAMLLASVSVSAQFYDEECKLHTYFRMTTDGPCKPFVFYSAHTADHNERTGIKTYVYPEGEHGVCLKIVLPRKVELFYVTTCGSAKLPNGETSYYIGQCIDSKDGQTITIHIPKLEVGSYSYTLGGDVHFAGPTGSVWFHVFDKKDKSISKPNGYIDLYNLSDPNCPDEGDNVWLEYKTQTVCKK